MITLRLRPLAAACAATMILFSACQNPPSDDGGTKPRPTGPRFEKEGVLHFINEQGDTLRTIDIEIADTESERTIGLMHRRSMPDTQGMLFIFEEEERRSFWMRNTLIGLDIMFIRANGEVESIAKYTVPLDERSIPSKGPSTYVLEVIEGFCDRYGIQEGTKVSYHRTGEGNAP
jgi:uncharacterized protein